MERKRSAADRRSERGRQGPLVSAGYILGVGLVCFASWFALDARQLHESAVGSPLGTRRTVSLDLTGPVARVEEALSLDRVENAANWTLGKTGTPGGSAIGQIPAPPGGHGVGGPPTSTTTAPVTSSTSGAVSTSTTTSTTAAPPPGPPPLAEPSARHPLRILVVGDSIGEDLGIGLASVLGGVAHVSVAQDAVGNTGLANVAYYDWAAQLQRLLASVHPQVVAVLLGGNDQQAFETTSGVATFGSALWRSAYQARVAALVHEATARGARVVWVGLPVMGPKAGLSNAGVTLENAVYAEAARSQPGAVYVSTWRLFENPAGAYSTFLDVPGQGLVQVRDSDEVHIDPPGGTDLLGNFVVRAIESSFHVHL